MLVPGRLSLEMCIYNVEFIFTAIKASSNERIWELATLQMIVGELVTQAELVCLHANASAITWGKSSQCSKMRLRISTGMESIELFIF